MKIVLILYDPSACNYFKCDLNQAIYSAPWRSEGGLFAAYPWNLPHLESLIDPPSVIFLNPPLGGKINLNYQDPDAGVLSSSGYGVKGIYIYI